MNLFEGDDLEATLLEARQDLSDQVTLNTIRLDHDEAALLTGFTMSRHVLFFLCKVGLVVGRRREEPRIFGVWLISALPPNSRNGGVWYESHTN